MQHKDQIKDLAVMVNEGLTIYITLHNKILKESGTFRSFLRNLFGCGTPMSSFLEESENLMFIWGGIHYKVEEYRLSAYSLLLKDEKRYFDILSRYVAALRRTVTALVDRQRLINGGIKELRNNPMTWKAQKQKESVYRTAIEEYSAIGKEIKCNGPDHFRRPISLIIALSWLYERDRLKRNNYYQASVNLIHIKQLHIRC